MSGASLLRVIALVVLFALNSAPALAGDSGQGRKSPVGGPDRVENQIESDAAPKDPLLYSMFGFLDPWHGYKKRLNEDSGFSVGLDYSSVFLGASTSPGEDSAASGMVRLYGSWELVGRESGNPGAFVYKVEHRHAYTDVAVSGFGFNTGYIGLWEPPFSDQKFRVTNLYWRQSMAGKRIAVFAGFVDATDFVDAYGLASPWLHFMNLTFSTGSAAIALPNDAALGLMTGAWISDRVYAIASLVDNASDPTDVFSGFDRFFNHNEYFTSVEIGWTTSRDRAYFDNIHVTAWHSDEKSETGDSDGWGLNGSATWFVKDKVMPFLRGGYAEDGGSLLQASVSAGVGYQWHPRRDLVGLAGNWGRPNETTWVSGLDDQYSFELFWRFQLADELAITPDIQFIQNPALNPGEDSIWIYGIRARLAI
jgi:porin